MTNYKFKSIAFVLGMSILPLTQQAEAKDEPAAPATTTKSTMLPCWYNNKSTAEMVQEKNCISIARAGSGSIPPLYRIAAKVLNQASYNSHGVAWLFIESTPWFFNKKGIMRETLNFDNGPDAYAEGRVRFVDAGKMGFLDETLTIVIPARYDFAEPFADGKARVCSGCRKQNDGEHSFYAGGTWQNIDLQGSALAGD